MGSCPTDFCMLQRRSNPLWVQPLHKQLFGLDYYKGIVWSFGRQLVQLYKGLKIEGLSGRLKRVRWLENSLILGSLCFK